MGLNALPMYAGFIIGLLEGFDLLAFTYPSVRCIHNLETNCLISKFTTFESFVKHSDALGIQMGNARNEIPRFERQN